MRPMPRRDPAILLVLLLVLSGCLGSFRPAADTSTTSPAPTTAATNMTAAPTNGTATTTPATTSAAPSPSGNETNPPWILRVATADIGADHASIVYEVRDNDSAVRSWVRWGRPGATTNETSPRAGHGEHIVTLVGLQPGGAYQAVVVARDAFNNQRTSNAVSFTTPNPGDTQPPVVTNVTHTVLGPDRARINWDLSDQSSGVKSLVEYGPGYGDRSTERTGTGAKSVELTGLPPDSDVYYRVLAYDPGNLVTRSTGGTFRTPQATQAQLQITGVSVSDVNDTSARVSWTVSSPNSGITSRVEIPGRTIHAPIGAGSRSVLVDTLAPSTTYTFQVIATDSTGTEKRSPEPAGQFTTSAPPVPVSIGSVAVTGVNTTSFTVTFELDGPDGLTSKVEYGTSLSYGSSKAAADGTGTKSVTLDGLAERTLYHFRIVAEADAETEETTDQEQSTAQLLEVRILSNSGGSSFAHDPSTLQASVPVEISVTNEDSMSHTWTNGALDWDSGVLGASTSTTLTKQGLTAGTYTFTCTLHPSMTGDLGVA